MNTPSFYAALALFVFACSGAAAAADPPQTPSAEQAAAPIPFIPSSVPDLRTKSVASVEDTKEGSVALGEPAPTVGEVTAQWSKQTGVSCMVEPSLTDRRIVWLSRPVPLASAMETVARLESLEWTRHAKPDGSIFYRLSEPEAVTQKREKAKAAFLDDWEQSKKRMSQALRQGLDSAAAQKTPGFGSVLDALTTSAQRDKMARIAQEPVGLISAGNQSHYHNHVTFAQPYSQLPENIKTTLGQLFNRPDYQGKAEIHYAPPVSDLSQLPQTQVGFVAAFGMVRLGIVSPDGKDVWVSPFDVVNPDQKALVDAAIADHAAGRSHQPPLVDLSGIKKLPDAVRNRRVRLKNHSQYRDTAELLQEIVLQCPELRVVCDAYLAGRLVSLRQLRMGGPFTVEDALTLLCQNSPHGAQFADGTLFLSTALLGRDLAAEPPALLVDDFKKAGAITWENVTAEARPSPIAHSVFTTAHPLLLKKVFLFSIYQSVRPFLAFYAQLSPTSQKQALSPSGLPYAEMTKEEKATFDEVADVGLPQTVSVLQKGTAGFTVNITRSDTGVITTVVLSTVSPRGNLARYSAKVPQKARSLVATSPQPSPPH